MKHQLLIMATLMTMAACSTQPEGQGIIGRQTVEATNGLLTPEILWAMGRVGNYSISPNAQQVAYNVSYYSVEQNKSHRVIRIMNADGNNDQLLTNDARSESDVCWTPDGQLAYLCEGQIWTMCADGTHRRQASHFDGEIEGFKFSPDGTKVMFVAQVPYGTRTSEMHPDLPKASGKVIDDLMYRHWDEWVETIPHVFMAPFKNLDMGEATDILKGEPYESPLKPFGGTEQLAWSPDSRYIAYTCRKKEHLEYAISTDSDIYCYDTESGTTTNLCKMEGDADQNMGYDTNPAFSPDGKYVSWLSMARDGYESDRNRLCVMNLESKQKQYVSESFQSGVDAYCWAANSNDIYFVGVWHGKSMIYATNLQGEVKQITNGQYDYGSVALLGGSLLASRHSMSYPDELYSVNLRNGEAAVLTHENDHIFAKLSIGKVEERWTETTDGKQMLSWVIYPPHFDPAKRYPTLLFCEGGPQSPVSQFWSYRWNMQIMAANGYIVIAPNRRGLPGFGMEWLEQISGDYSGQCMRDLLSAIDDISCEPYVDTEHLGCVGASFGGYSVYWLAGNHDKRFKAFIAHDGIYNLEQQYVETEEMWFVNWDLGGAPWDKDNATAQRSYANSPHRFVDKWDTPILCIHGERDYRIVASQAMSAFNAARLRGIPAQLLVFPDENHWVLKPQNGVLWQRTFFAWLDKWLKPQQ